MAETGAHERAQHAFVRMPRYLGLHALNRLPCPGAVIVDPRDRVMYFVTDRGARSDWELTDVDLLSELPYKAVPPADRQGPPGPYWLVEPGSPWRRTDLVDLHAAAVFKSAASSDCRPSVLPLQRGAYVVVESTVRTVPPEPPWTGRVQQRSPGGAVQLVSPTGYEWWTDPKHLREATQQERDTYDAARRGFLHPCAGRTAQ